MDTKSLPRLSEITARDIREQQSTDFCRWLSCLATARMPDAASEMFLERWPTAFSAPTVRKSLEVREIKAATPPGSTGGWGQPLVGIQTLATGFAAIAHSASLLARVPGLNLIPFKTKVPVENSPASYGWVTEESAKPVSKISFSAGVTLDPLKATGLVVLTQEFLKLTERGTEVALRNTLQRGLVAFQDLAFLSPTSTAIVGQRPASVTAGLVPTANTGNLQADVTSLLSSFFSQRPGASADTVLIANAQKSAQLRALNPGFGLEIIPTEAAGGTVVVVDGRGIYYADGGVLVDVSREASIQMADVVDSPPTASTIPTSLWQMNLIAYLVERTLNWYATPTSVAYLAA